MTAVDRRLLRAIGRERPRVALLPTASGLEPGMPEQWNRRGAAHFAQLEAEPLPLSLIGRADAQNHELAAQIAACDLAYLSGGQPDYLIETLAGSAALEALRVLLERGGGLAGCSAGAMMMGAVTVSIRSVLHGGRLKWRSALGIAGNLVIIPHFDRVHLFLPDDQLETALHELPPQLTVVGIDEFTALCDYGDGWQVSGLHTVTVFGPRGSTVYRAGQYPDLPSAVAVEQDLGGVSGAEPT